MTKKKRELPPLRPSEECSHENADPPLLSGLRCEKCCPCSVCARWRWDKENS